MHMESETDTEVIVKLMSHLFNHNNAPTFYQLVEAVVTNLVCVCGCVRFYVFVGVCVCEHV